MRQLAAMFVFFTAAQIVVRFALAGFFLPSAISLVVLLLSTCAVLRAFDVQL